MLPTHGVSDCVEVARSGVDSVNNSNRVDKTSGTYHVSGASECTSGATSLHVIGSWTLICIN